ncbi:MAG: hypothetical protein M1836_003444 [Candelina mexicana]|nr:MAG: hypothetical protein M1836_003444 [Candelina mexicana]
MPKVLGYTPAWLSRPSPGFDTFSTKPSSRSATSSNVRSPRVNGTGADGTSSYVGPRRTIARRDTEIFVVVGNQIRWSELCMLKDDWEESQQLRAKKAKGKRRSSANNGIEDEPDEEDGSKYRVLKVPVTGNIQQLVPSPNGDFIAILTSHTVHVAILPDSSHLGQPDTGPIRLKTHTLGPTTHVFTQSPVVSALWHPLGVSGSCLVTITAEAVVRVWELSRDNRWSFDSPSLIMDLRKLADAISSEQDFGASGISSNRGFSPDSVEMEVAAACFGGTGLAEEHGWASMTLWVAMREGDVYALCPLLPSKWQPAPTMIPSLSTYVVAKAKALENDCSASEEDRQACDQQYKWFSEVDGQDPQLMPGASEFAPHVEIYHRPTILGSVPKLQGPFQLDPEPDEPDIDPEIPLTDILVIGAKVDADELLLDEDDESVFGGVEQVGLSVGVVCLVSSNGRVQICLDVDGVEGRWLPKGESRSNLSAESIPPSLLVLESLDTMHSSEVSKSTWPMFTSDPLARYSFFLTHGSGVSYLSLTPWVDKFESELKNTADAGASFRMDIVLQGSNTLRQRILHSDQETDQDQQDLSACLALQDSDLGYFTLTTAGGQAYAAILDQPTFFTEQDPSDIYLAADMQALMLGPPRSAYQPSTALWSASSLPSFIETHVHTRHKRTLKEEIRFSAATLDLMTSAHRILSQETNSLGMAAANIFRHCERMTEEFKDQIKRASDLAHRIEFVVGDDADDYDDVEKKRGNEGLQERLDNATERQKHLVKRQEELRKKLARIGGRELSEKELTWGQEVRALKGQVFKIEDKDQDENENEEDDEGEGEHETWRRVKEATRLKEVLLSRIKDLAEAESDGNGEGRDLIPSEIRKAKVGQVMGLLERE